MYRLQELYDVLAQRDAAQEAFCSVCGDGHSGGCPVEVAGILVGMVGMLG